MGKDSKGLTFIELLIALSIGSLVIGISAITTNQLFWLGSRNQDHMKAVCQVQNAGYWISRDGVMAQTITLGKPSGFPLSFSWTNWDTNQTITVTYILDNNILIRHQAKGNDVVTTTVARYITSAWAEFPFQNKKLLTVTITAQVGTQTETRIYKITPRATG